MNKLCNIGGTIAGILSVIFSFVIVGMDTGSYEQNLQYGGDAYSGIQNASAQAANNVKYLADLVRFGLFALLFIIGIALICYFLKPLLSEMKLELPKNPEQNDTQDIVSDSSEETPEVEETPEAEEAPEVEEAPEAEETPEVPEA